MKAQLSSNRFLLLKKNEHSLSVLRLRVRWKRLRAMAGDGLPSNMTGMSKVELYDVMSQMKVLIYVYACNNPYIIFVRED